jgi:hypothetical protein
VTDGVESWSELSGLNRQPVDPKSPAAARTVCPWAAAWANRVSSDLISDWSPSSSHSPHDVDTTWSVSWFTIAEYRS